MVAGGFEDVGEVGAPHQALRAVGVVDLFDDVVGVAKWVRLFGAGVDVGDFDVDVGIFCPVEQVGENGFGVGFVDDGAANVIDDDFDLGVTSDDGFYGGVVFAFAKEVECEVEVSGAFPEGVLGWACEVGVGIAGEVDSDAAETLFGGEAFELVGGIRRGGIDQGLSGEFVGVFLDAVGHVAVVEEVVNGLHDDGFVNARCGHCFKEQFDGAGLAGGTGAVRIFFGVVAPDVQMWVDDHFLAFRCVLQEGVDLL